MKKLIPLLALLSLALSACGDLEVVTAGPDPFRITPSRPPVILTATPRIVFPTTSATLPPPPSLTPSLTFTAGPSPTFTLTPTSTETFTPTPTFTNTPVPLTITLLGCDTGFDVSHGMGEVTNAYVIVANHAASNLTYVCATLSSDDEGRAHPDKTVCTQSLPTGFQVTLKLTVDTTYNVNTSVGVTVASNQGIGAAVSGQVCKGIGAFKPPEDTIGVVQPIP